MRPEEGLGGPDGLYRTNSPVIERNLPEAAWFAGIGDAR